MVDTIGNDLKQMQGSIFNNKEGLKMFYGITFQRKSGKVVQIVEHISGAALKFYGMNNLTAARDFVAFNGSTGLIICYYEGKGKRDFPKIHKDMEGTPITDIVNAELLREVIGDIEEE